MPNVRGPVGFCCETSRQLLDGWAHLTTAHPTRRLVLKPASGSGGDGVVLNATKVDVEALAARMSGTQWTKQVGLGEGSCVRVERGLGEG